MHFHLCILENLSFKELTDTLTPNKLQSLTLSQRPRLCLRITHLQLIPAVYQSEDNS